MGCKLILVICVTWLLLLGSSGCYSQPGEIADGYARAEVKTWLDADGDSERSSGESPLPWVTIQMAYETSITDSSGRGQVGIFKAGCASRCWEGESVSVRVPPGYRPTTPIAVRLRGQEHAYEFGFQLEEGASPLSFPEEPDWFRAFTNRGLELVDFHYAASGGQLAVSFDVMGNPALNALYQDIFDVIRTLRRIEGVSINRVEITGLPADKIVVCEMEVVEEWRGRISPAEIVSRHCDGR